MRRNLRAFCLGVRGFTNPPISKAFAFDHFQQLIGAFGIRHFECCAAIVSKIEFGKVAMQMRFTAVLVDTACRA